MPDDTNIPDPMTGAEAQVNWSLLRRSLERDLASARAASKRTGDFFDHRAYAYQLVLDSMDVFEFGLAYWQAKTQAERDALAAPGVPGLAERTQAASEPIDEEIADTPGGPWPMSGWDALAKHAEVAGLAEHTQAACDTITKASQ